jgi:NADH dehydrogenase [ubiquinone] 1 alpha subcomplex assembly factor 7
VTPLERALHQRIKAEGPITVEAYMEACNSYYYSTRDPLGVGGDFTTAPEISQMFGELVGATLTDCWTRAGSPTDAIYVELGPGRGTLAADALRVMRAGGFTGEVHFVETSPVLRELQRAAVPDAHWHETIEDLPARPLLLIANEFLDALAIHQHVEGIERRVVIAAGGLTFDRDGEIVESSPARDNAVSAISTCLAAKGGVAIIVDYGHAPAGPGDTLQAVRDHRYASVLEKPGEQDLTAHVDFQAVARSAREAGVSVTSLMTQGDWLRALGISIRGEALARANPKRREEIEAGLHRLTSGEEMGELFKVIGVHAPNWPAPPGFE